MGLWLIAIAAASVSGQPVQIPGAAPPPHMHYEIWIDNVAGAPLTDAKKLERACALAGGISARLGSAEKRDTVLQFFLVELSATTCGKPKSK